MEPFLPGVIIVAVGTSAAVAASVMSVVRGRINLARRAEMWRQISRDAALTDVREKRRWGTLVELRGAAEGLDVFLTDYHERKNRHGTLVTVDGRGQIPACLGLRGEGLGTILDATFGGRELWIGDPGFDAAVYAQGPEESLRPLLDGEARSALRELVAMGGRVANGAVRVAVHHGATSHALMRTLTSALRAARCVRRPDNEIERLAGIARNDYFATVRLRCLELLARRHTRSEVARDAFRQACQSPDAEIRLAGAAALAEEGTATLLELASSTSGDESVATRAIEALGAHLPFDTAVSILDNARTKGRRMTARAAIEALPSSGGPAAVAPLSALLGRSAPDLEVAAVRALAATGAKAAEPALIAALASGHGDVRAAAAAALGRVGTAAAVEPLRTAIDAHFLDLDLRSAARQAIASIQSRLPGASPGQISLAQAESGDLSIADDAATGRVSIVKE